MLQEKTFAAGATNVNYLDYGPSSAAPLVMLHGGAWRWQEYLSLIPSLGQRWHIYALDLRGMADPDGCPINTVCRILRKTIRSS